MLGLATTMLNELQKPSSLRQMALEVVVGEGLEVRELPAILRREVEEWPARRREEARGKGARLQAGPGKALVRLIRDM